MAKEDNFDEFFYRHETPKGRKPVNNKKPSGKKIHNKKSEEEKRKKKKLGEMNVVMYLRKSSEEEEKQFNSTRDQEKKCRAYIEALEASESVKINIVKKYEEHHSAAHAGERKEFNEMLEGIKAGRFDAILAYHPDRLSRNMLEAGILLDMIRPEKGEEVGVLQDLLFPTVAFTNDSGGRLMLAVLFSMATQYSDHLSEVVQRGVDGNLEKGKSSGTPKWGYTRNRVTGYYEPDDNFDLIRQGWEMILDGSSQAAVLDFWKDNDVHYHTVEGANKVSRKVKMEHKTAVSRLFKDPFYYGILVQAGKEVDLRRIPEANFEPMVTEDEYDRVQEILEGKYQNHRRIKEEDKAFIPFQGMIICEHCGRKLYGYLNKKRRLVYYGHQNKAAREDCERIQDKSVTNEVRGNTILDEVYKALDNLKPTKKDYERYLRVAKHYTDDMKDEMIREKRSKLGILSQYKREEKDETESYKVLMRDKNAPEAVKKSISDKLGVLQHDIQRLEKDIAELTAKIDTPERALLNERDFLNFLKNAPQQMRELDFVGKDILLRSIFLNLRINKQNKVTFLCKPEFSDLFKTSNVVNGGVMWT